MSTMEYEKNKVFKIVVLAGEILLSNGAEIFRVEDTMLRIANAYGIKDLESFVIANGIFVTAEGEEGLLKFKIKYIPTGTTNLEKIELVNHISREIELKHCEVDETNEKLIKILNKKTYSPKAQIAAYGLGSGSFCYFLGGDIKDTVISCLLGIILGIVMTTANTVKISKMLSNILGSAIMTILAIVVYNLGLGNHIDKIIIGSIIPLVPGVAFTNAVRDFMENAYISGTVRMLDSILIAFSIALGVGVVWSIMR
ncbi:MAG: threonine/serine exporter family protein [Herbinix sp.]|nr:threonine/serine exporter family protein [Herbinix sp.]